MTAAGSGAEPHEERCPACGDLVEVQPVGGHDADGAGAYRACPRCGSAWLHPRPATDPVELYDAGYFTGGVEGGYGDYEADADLHRANAEERLDRIDAARPDAGPGRLLDVGCAHGYLLHVAVARGWEVAGVEVAGAARAAAGRRGHRVVARLAELEPDERFDVVGLFQALEHLADPHATLRAVHDHLVPGGLVVVETWDRASRTARAFRSAWQQHNPPTVLHLFTRRGLRRLLDRSGFSGVRVERTTKLVSLGLATSVVVHRLGPLRPAAERLLARPALAGRSVRYRLDDLVTATASAAAPTAAGGASGGSTT